MAWCLFALAPFAHEAWVQHRICADHGAWSHAAAPPAGERTEAGRDPCAGRRPAAPPHDAAHHCRTMAEHRVASDRAAGAMVPGATWSASVVPVVPAVVPPPGPARHRLAPKQSPPGA